MMPEIKLTDKTIKRLDIIKNPRSSYNNTINGLIEFLLINTPTHNDKMEKDFGIPLPFYEIWNKRDVDKYFKSKGVK